MPRRTDLESILIIGSGPIVIGQACEFDYAGTQAVKALRSEGLRIVLVNSNPATIMTDPGLADATYVEPLTVEVLEEIIRIERPTALLPTLGGQTGLNLAVACGRQGVLERHGVELLGVTLASIEMAENRELFRQAMERIGLACPASRHVASVEEARAAAAELGFPVILRPSFTLGGAGSGIANDVRELETMVQIAIDLSPIGKLLVEQSVLGWKEFELEVVRDGRDNCIIVCSIENIDPMGVHTGDSITVAPAMTLTDKELQRMRDAAIAVIREIGVTTGGSNVQFAVEPSTGRMLVIEMNPRVSRSSALASKATGFPIAKVAAKLAIGYTLDEISNDITRVTPASFEPTLDYVVIKVPRFAFEKFPDASTRLGPQMRSVGEVMAIGRTFREALGKAIRSLELGRAGFDLINRASDDLVSLERQLAAPGPERLFQLGRAFQLGLDIERAYQLTGVDRWFLHQIRTAALLEIELAAKSLGSLRIGSELAFSEHDLGDHGLDHIVPDLRSTKRAGLSDRRIAALVGTTEDLVRATRHRLGIRPVYKRVDTCAAELASQTPYLYSAYEDECEAAPSTKRKVVILGSGPNRIGQGIEFDYCCVHAADALRDEGIESIMINCNPETVSTDWDTADRLYFEPLTLEDVLEVCHVEQPEGVIVQLGGQTPLKLAVPLANAGLTILGTSADAIDRAEDRARFAALLDKLGLRAPLSGTAGSLAEARHVADRVGYPVIVRPSYVLGGRAIERIVDEAALDIYFRDLVSRSGKVHASERREGAVVGLPLLIDRFLVNAVELDVDVLADRVGKVIIGGVMEHVEPAGIHSGDSACALPPYSIRPDQIEEVGRQSRALARELGVIGLMNVQFAILGDEIYVLEANPRASRTIPFVSKATGCPLAKLATRLMLGRTLDELGVSERTPNHVSVKEVVLPFLKFEGVALRLGPEMRSTGEVMGIDHDFARAFAKSQAAAGNPLPSSGDVMLALDSAAELEDLGPDFARLGFSVAVTGEMRSGSLRHVDRETAKHELASRRFALAIITARDATDLRSAALRSGTSYVTTMRAARAAHTAIMAGGTRGWSYRSLQQWT